ncbi:MAG TPA: GGDEF domain-containing protein [Kofleriaceae bacterium]|nr:GGDEF domain-containing protein [Kofleriaceae bacterium]
MLDPRSVLLMVCLGSMTLATMLLLTFRRNPKEVAAWCLSLVAGSISLASLALRGVVPEIWAVLATNVPVAFGFGWQAAALAQFENKPWPTWRLLPFAAGAVAVSMLPNMADRIAVFGALYGSAYLILAFLSSRLSSASRVVRAIMVISFALGSALFVIRGVIAVLQPQLMSQILGGNIWQSLTMSASFLVVMCSSFGYLLLYKERADQQAARLATIDPLTGALNRRMLTDLGERALARSRRRRASMSVVMLDIDHFKSINDRFGHVIGDGVLQRFVEVLQRELRAEDTLIRYGGEEFCLLMPEQTLDEARIVAERLRAAIGVAKLQVAEHLISIGLSAGVASLAADDVGTLQGLLSAADQALYRAKNNGRNRVELASAPAAAAASAADQ